MLDVTPSPLTPSLNALRYDHAPMTDGTIVRKSRRNQPRR